MQNFRKRIEKTVINLANQLKDKGLFTTIQIILYGNNKNVAPLETTFK